METKDLPDKTLEFFNGDALRAKVFYEKYALRDKRNRVLEKTPREMWKRISTGIASMEPDSEEWRKEFFWLLNDFKFVPGGRINYSVGNKYVKSCPINCYFLPVEEDSIEGIFETMKKQARTFSYGGGVGIDISVLRPRGANVSNSARFSTGAASFMDLFSQVTGTIGQYNRRGALLLTMDIQHPDIAEFIEAKDDESRQHVKYANISVKVRDRFMEAMEEDRDWILWYPDKTDIKHSEQALEVETVYDCFEHPDETFFHVNDEPFIRVRNIYEKIPAKELWKNIIKKAWNSGEPGLIYWDRVKEYSNSEYFPEGKVHGMNPCAETTLPSWGLCDLGHINLTKVVENEYSDNAKINWKKLKRIVKLGVRFLDNIISYSEDKHPIKKQAEVSIKERRIGLGITGLGEVFSKFKLKYDSKEAGQLTDKIMQFIRNMTYKESVELAKEKGAFPKFDVEEYLENEFIKQLPEKIQKDIIKYGIRNVALLTVAPVGTGSILSGTTSGIEPIYALKYKRKTKSMDEGEYEIWDYSIRDYIKENNIGDVDELPDYFQVAHDICPPCRVRLQGVAQKYIDMSISSTVNLDRNVHKKTVKDLYKLGWEEGLKGLTIFREGSRDSILEAQECEKCNQE